MVAAAKLYIYIDISLNDLRFIEGHSCMRKQKLPGHFLQIFQLIWMKFGMPQLPVGLFNIRLTLFAWLVIKGENPTSVGVIEVFKNCLHLDTYELISFKLWRMIHLTKPYILIPVWITLTFTKGHMVTRKLELVCSFCCKVTWPSSSPIIGCGLSCKEHYCKKKVWVWQVWIAWKCALLVFFFFLFLWGRVNFFSIMSAHVLSRPRKNFAFLCETRFVTTISTQLIKCWGNISVNVSMWSIVCHVCKSYAHMCVCVFVCCACGYVCMF